MSHVFCKTCADQKRISTSVTIRGVMVCLLECDHHVCLSIAANGTMLNVVKFPCWGCDESITPETVDPGTGLCKPCSAKMLTDSYERTPDMGKRVHGPGTNHTPPATTPPAAKVDNAKVAAAMALAVGHVVGITDTYDKSINYVTAENGLFEVRESDLCRVISAAPKKVLGVTGEMKEGIILKTPRIPFELLAQTVAFFRGAYKKMNGPTEAFVQIWWNWTDKKYVLHVPEQEVSAASVKHESKFGQGEDAIDWMHVMDMHSHGTMPGFYSGTDDADERRVNGERFSGVIGKVQDAMPDWNFRLITRGQFVPVPVTMIFDFSAMDIPFHINADILMRATAEQGAVNNGQVRLFCPVDMFKESTFPAEWLDQLKARSYGGGSGVAGFHQTGARMGGSTATSGTSQSYRSRTPGPVPSGARRFVFIDHEEMEVLSDGNLRKTGNSIRPEV